MKTCHVCGTIVDDRELVCPECGATVVKSTSGLSLKGASEDSGKKKLKEMADRLADEEEQEENYIQGSLPVSLSKNTIDEDMSAQKKSKLVPTLIKLILLAVVCLGVYAIYTNVIKKDDKQSTIEGVLDIYIEAVNAKDADKLSELLAPYVDEAESTAKLWLDGLSDIQYDSYKLSDKKSYDKDEIKKLQDAIKYATTKTSNIVEACDVRIELSESRGVVQKIQFQMVKVRDTWYINLTPYISPL